VHARPSVVVSALPLASNRCLRRGYRVSIESALTRVNDQCGPLRVQ
jgi:hypothetical protein